MKSFTSYFYNIKAEFDHFPEIIDFIDKKMNYKDVYKLFHKLELDNNKEVNLLNDFLLSNNFTESNLKNKINNLRKIPFGNFYMMRELDSTLHAINELTFEEFYYFKYFHTIKTISHLKIYENLKSQIGFNKDSLEFLENKNNQLEFIRIIRRKTVNDSMKGIVKFKLIEFNQNFISPDIIEKIELNSNKSSYIIYNSDIYYDNDVDVTAYIDNLNENINEVIITNNFGGEIRVKHILNIQGSGTTRKMLKDNIEKLFLIPFFKLFEIIYSSLKDQNKYEKLKEQNFGKNFKELKILKPLETQKKIFYDLLFLSRPDLLGKSEKKLINKFIMNELTEEQNNYLEEKLGIYYDRALQLQKNRNINCCDSEMNSIAKRKYFPAQIEEKIKKLFMCDGTSFESNNFISETFDNSYISEFSLEELIIEVLQEIEKNIQNQLNNLNVDMCKKYLNTNIGILYNKYIVPNVYFILILILSSIEGGDYIIFNHKLNWDKIQKAFLKDPLKIIPAFPSILFSFKKGYEKDFEKSYSVKNIEEMNMKKLFYKIKTKYIVNSNVSPNDFNSKIDSPENKNKIRDFSEYSENQKTGEKYYQKFLQLLNNYSNDFPEDIEISIYDNLKEENKNKDKNYLTIKEIINDLISNEESKKGFLALVRQSYLLGKLRSNIVSIKTFNFQILGR